MIKLVKKYMNGVTLVIAALAPAAMFVEVFMDLMQPRLLSDMIDIGIANRDLPYVFMTGGRMVLVALLGFVGGAACSVLSSIASTDLGTGLRQGLFDKIQTLSFKELDEFKTSSLITRLTNDVTQVQNMLVLVLRGAVRAPLLCIGGVIMAVISSPGLSVIFLIAIPIILIATIILLKKSFPLFAAVQETMDRINTVMRESILGIRVIKALTIEERQREKFDNVNRDLMERSVKAQNRNMLLWPIIMLVMNCSVVAVLWFGGIMVNGGDIEIGKIMAFINYLVQIMGSLIMVLNIILSFTRAKASADRINEVFMIDPAIGNCCIAEHIRGTDIEFRNVSFRYNEHSENVLSNINLTINEGEKIGIIGSTGAGKSTFVNLIPRLYDVTEGQVLIGGIDVRKIKVEELRSNVGVILQDSVLFSGTIEKNLKFGNSLASYEEMEAAAKDAQAYDFILEKENGYQSTVEQRGRNFSGGQKQRMSIARTLIRNPRILIMDDSSSALDVATEARLLNAVKKRTKNSTIIMIAQRISGVMDADRILVIDSGRLSAVGTHRELLKESELYRNIAVSQLGEEVLLNA